MTKRVELPTFHIQNDWEDNLNKIAGEIWFTCKRKDECGKHGKIVRKGTCSDSVSPTVTATEGFFVNLLTHNAVQIGCNDHTYSCIFVASRNIYSGVHKKSITSLDVSEGSICVSVSQEDDSNAVVWLIEGEHKLLTFVEHVGTIYKARWFPSGKVVISFGADMDLKIWCSETARCPVLLKGHIRAVTDVAFIDRGRNVVSVSKDGSCRLWDCGQAECLATLLSLNSSLNCCSISTTSCKYRLTEEQLPPAHEREIGTDNKIVLVGSENGQVHCIAIRSRTILFSLQFDSAINCSCCIEPGLFVVGCQNGNIHLISLGDTHLLASWLETNSPALCLLPYKGNGFFVGHEDGSCVYRSVKNLSSVIRMALTGSNGDPIYDICCDSKFIYTACRDSYVRKYSPDSYIARHFDFTS